MNKQQLIAVINSSLYLDGDLAEYIADKIIAAVNDGTCDPIVPKNAVLIFPADNYRSEMAELAELRKLKAIYPGIKAEIEFLIERENEE